MPLVLVMKLKISPLVFWLDISLCARQLLRINGNNFYKVTETFQWPHYFHAWTLQADQIWCDYIWILKKHYVDLLEETLAQEYLCSLVCLQSSVLQLYSICITHIVCIIYIVHIYILYSIQLLCIIHYILFPDSLSPFLHWIIETSFLVFKRNLLHKLKDVFFGSPLLN